MLELFLKRNGVKVEVFTERASVAPIKSKGHLNFNVWVSCASLQGMLEALYRDIDVFILDRGVFDALVRSVHLFIVKNCATCLASSRVIFPVISSHSFQQFLKLGSSSFQFAHRQEAADN